jgi:hypothetical protein
VSDFKSLQIIIIDFRISISKSLFVKYISSIGEISVKQFQKKFLRNAYTFFLLNFNKEESRKIDNISSKLTYIILMETIRRAAKLYIILN